MEQRKKEKDIHTERMKEARKTQSNDQRKKEKDINTERRKEARKTQSNEQRKTEKDINTEIRKEARKNQSMEQKNNIKEINAERMKESRADARENPINLGIARRFTIDQGYFHDIIESCEGPLKVWCKGEKLEHDIFWQKVTAGRYASSPG